MNRFFLLILLTTTCATTPLLAVPAFAAPADVPLPRLAGLADGQSSNLLSALAILPDTVAPFTRMYNTLIFGGTVAPSTKIQMGLKIAEQNHAPYVKAHLARLLAALPKNAVTPSALSDTAVAYAGAVTTDVHGGDKAPFAALRTGYNDAQIVELVSTVAFFNYLTRLANATNVAVEDWAKTPASAATIPILAIVPLARVTLASDAELDAAIKLKTPPATPAPAASSLGTFIPNSRRAMIRVPDIADAWFGYMGATRAYTLVSRPEKLQVSFAVSMANGCRYCTLHQVLGLRRAGVDVAKLVAMKKDDGALTPREQVAVTYARKLTRTPGAVTDADRKTLSDTFTPAGAIEVILQTCTFNFMNRFTDPLGLPSEDEATEAYRDVYGADAYKNYFSERTR